MIIVLVVGSVGNRKRLKFWMLCFVDYLFVGLSVYFYIDKETACNLGFLFISTAASLHLQLFPFYPFVCLWQFALPTI